MRPEAERRRLNNHFERVLRRLHQRSLNGLTATQKRARRLHLERLEKYNAAGVFPKNRFGLAAVVPIFIDSDGTRCAMGHLIEKGGGADVVHYIAAERNFERVAQLANIPELLNWLEENGLTAEEAAAIQPSYCEAPAQCVCQSASVGTLADGIVTGTGPVTVDVKAIFGDPQDLAVGSVITLTAPQNVEAVVGDRVLVNYHPKYNPEDVQLLWTVGADGLLTIGNCTWYATIPGPLPADVLASAIVLSETKDCYAKLGEYDAGWTTYAGDGCGSSGSGASGAGNTTGGSGGSGGDGDGGGHEGGHSPKDTVGESSCAIATGCPSVIAPSTELVIAIALGACLMSGTRRILKQR